VLHGERNADDGHGGQTGEYHVSQGDPDTADQYPQNVHHGRQNARIGRLVDYLRAEWANAQDRQFKALHAERDAHDGEAKEQPSNQVSQEDQNPSTQDNP